MDHITIKFPDDHRTIIIHKPILQQYPHSVIYSHLEVFPELSEMELKIPHDDFEIIYKAMLGNLKQWEMPEHISTIASELGLINDRLYDIGKVMNAKRDNALARIEKFISISGNIFVPDCIAEYLEYKKIFATSKNIIPFQVVMLYGDICSINIYDGLPIYFDHSFEPECCYPHQYVNLKGLVNVNETRECLFFTGYDGGDGDTYVYVDSDIYSSDEIVFLEALLTLFIKIADAHETNIIFGNCTPSQSHYINVDLSSQTYNSILNIIKSNKNEFTVSKENLISQKYLYAHDSYAFPDEDGNTFGTQNYHFNAYCGFVNVGTI